MTKTERVLNNTRVSEVNWVTQQIVDEYQKGDYSSDAYLSPAMEKVIGQNGRLRVAIMRDALESELAELDDVADNEVTLLHGLTKGYTCHPDENKARAAYQLFKMVDKYGLEVKEKGYNEEYPLLRSMIAESKTDVYKACFEALPACQERFNLLEAAVNNFSSKQNAFNLEKDERKEKESASVIKKQLLDLLNNEVMPYLDVMQKVKTDLYGGLTQFAANRISESNAAVRNRGNKSGDK